MPILIKPVITEKTMGMTKKNWYTFAVPVEKNKNDVKELIEKIFKVKVLDIKSLIVKGKNKRSLKSKKMRSFSDWKKIMVLLKEGQKIDLFDQAQ